MRFELSKNTPPHLNRGLQLRMLGFVALFAIVLFTLNVFSPKQNGQNSENLNGRRTLMPDADPRDRRDGSAQQDDSFLAPPDLKTLEPEGPVRPENWTEPPAMEDTSPEAQERKLARLEARFDKRILDHVKDNTVGILRSEADAYYQLLDHARHVPVDELDQAALTDVQYINLVDQPYRFRGEPIRIYGDLVRLRKFPASPNVQGIRAVYEAWVVTPDSAPRPYRVICTSVSRELQPGDDLRKPVHVTAYFFKREGYASNGGLHVAPTMLGHQLEPYRPPGAPPKTDAIVPYMVGFVSAVGLAFIVTLVSFTISDRRAAKALLQRQLNEPSPSFAGIDVGPSLSIEESLRLMAEKEMDEAARKSGMDPATQLHARDKARAPRTIHSAPAPTNEEKAEQLQNETKAVQNWSAHRTADQSDQPAHNAYQQLRERNEANRVLERLESEAAESPESSSADSRINENEISSNADAEKLDPHNEGRTFSKLAAWEQEVEDLRSQREPSRPVLDLASAKAELEQDRRIHDEQLNEHLRLERANLELEQRPENTEHERADSSIPPIPVEPQQAVESSSDEPTLGHLKFDGSARSEHAKDSDSFDDDEDSDRSHGRGHHSHRRRRGGR